VAGWRYTPIYTSSATLRAGDLYIRQAWQFIPPRLPWEPETFTFDKRYCGNLFSSETKKNYMHLGLHIGRKVCEIFPDHNKVTNLSINFHRTTTPNCTQSRLVGAGLMYADRHTDRKTDVAKTSRKRLKTLEYPHAALMWLRDFIIFFQQRRKILASMN
jgi:hypothetical protein